MSSQWSSVTDLDWDTDVDPEKLVATAKQPNAVLELVRAAAQVDGSPFRSWSDKDYLALGIEFAENTASDYEQYDEVARDRAAVTAAAE